MRTSERVTLTPAYVLHQRAWRESSRIIEIFSREHGRLGLVARGIRRPSSAFRAILTPFRPLLLSWTLRGELGTLTQTEASGIAPPLSGPCLMGGFYLNELLLLLTARHDSLPELYDQYGATLQAIADPKALEPRLRLFELHLLRVMGYGLNLDQDAVSGEPVLPDVRYQFELEQGPVRVDNDAVVGFTVRGATLQALQTGEIKDVDSLREARELLRAALDAQLGGRRLKTREVLRELNRYRSRATRT